jgi:iron(III) transport system substrate-binding protein
MKKLLVTGILSLAISATMFAFGGKSNKELNLYTHRHYDTDKVIIKEFEKETGIKVNVVKAKADELIKKLEIEGKNTPADLLITADAGRLVRAKDKGLLQPVVSEDLVKNIPTNLRDRDNYWYGLTVRARIIAYNPSKTSAAELSTYEDLADPKWQGKVLIRSSSNIYNQSLIASMIANDGEAATKKWAEGMVKNMARSPKGNDRDQAKGVMAGVGEVAVLNTYYMGKMMNSSNPKEVAVAKTLKVFFPNQDNRGAHVNVSGIAVTKYAKNKENAIKFIEYLSANKAQKLFAEANYEYPVNPKVEASELVKSWGTFKADTLDLTKLGEYNSAAVKLADEAGWK